MSSLMAASAPRSSVFTFESTVHSSHVLRCLDEQRRRDTLCDVTVVVEGQSFRAHRSVLASCCEYFTLRISSLTQHGAVITLPQEVTVAGFEPLLKFAYTSKLLFGKDDVVDIRNSASVLGFRDLDEACFDFLLPKFLSSKGSAPFPRKTCCKKKCKRRLSKEGIISDDAMLDEKDDKAVADSPSQQVAPWLCDKPVNSKIATPNGAAPLAPVAEAANEQCPKYRRQLACGKETVVEKSLNNPVTVIKDEPDLSGSPCPISDYSKNEADAEMSGNSPTGSSRQCKGWTDPWKAGPSGGEVDMDGKETYESQGKWSEAKTDMDVEEDIGFLVKPPTSGSNSLLGERSSGLILHHCPLKTFGEGSAITGSLGHERFVVDITEGKKIKDYAVLAPASINHKAEELVKVERKGTDEESGWQERQKGGHTSPMEGVAQAENNARERAAVEREEAEDLAKRPGSDTGPCQPGFQGSDAGSSSDTGGGRALNMSPEWLNHVNLSSTSTSCPFFQDSDQSKCFWKGSELSEFEGASQSGVSSLNSGEDGDSETETEGDSESNTSERARQMHLPVSVDWIVDLSRNDFQQLLKQQVFTQEQQEFVHDMRRRSKNRLAAQRCRKRKLDCIYNLQCEINKLKAEREKLITEKNQLGQQKLKTCHTVSALCQRVCGEANMQPEQLQVLAKYTSPDCPLSSFFPHVDALLSEHGLPLQVQASLAEYLASEEAPPGSSRDPVTGDLQRLL